ncbi:Scn11a [Symbiodinium necroappetens]|uniref:Scn11a protein n=1 Tax=Symbiodinium necroappetens TaxID=1628268 RepID=A0A812KT39_9DINO|nr:Scn11a [Symbiodinium necroappetens]
MDGTGFVGPRIEISERLPELGADIQLDWDQKAKLPASAGVVQELFQQQEVKLAATIEVGFKQLQDLLAESKSQNGLQALQPTTKRKKRQRASGESTVSKSDSGSNGSEASAAVAESPNKNRTSLLNLESLEVPARSIWSVDCCSWLPSEENPPTNRLSRIAQKMVSSWMFETFFAGVIMTNSIFIAVQVELSAAQPGRPPDGGMFIVSTFYSVLFTIELLIRLAAVGPRLYCGQDWAWTLLDTLVVATSVFEFIVELPVQQDDVDDSQSLFGNMRLLRILRIAKITRAVRIIRLVKFVRALRSLLFCIGKTLKAMAWSAALLVLIIFLFGLVFTDITTEYFANPELHWNPVTTDFLRLRFSSLELSMHTLFASITGGFTWVEARDAFAELSFVWGPPAHIDQENAKRSSHPRPFSILIDTMPTMFGCLAC